MTDRSELVERLVRIDATTHCLICLSGPERDLIVAALRAPALPSEEEMRSKILDLIESRPMNGLNAEGNYVKSIYWAQRGYINGLRAVLALIGKTERENLMTDRSELAERIENAIAWKTYCGKPSQTRALLIECSEALLRDRSPAMLSEEEMRRKILDAIESSQVSGLNAEGDWIMMPIDGFNGYINGLRAALALLGKTGGEK